MRSTPHASGRSLTEDDIMQPDWLRRYFNHQHDVHLQHDTEPDETAKAEYESGVSRRDFVKSSFAAGMAAGMAAGTIASSAPEAEAEEDHPMGKWWPSEWGPE